MVAASNTSTSNFYRKFPSKAHLLLALLEDEVHLVDRQLRESIDASASVDVQLRTWLRYHIGAIYDRVHAQRTRLFLDQDLVDVLPEQVGSLHGILDNLLAEIIRRGVDNGELRPGDPESDARFVGYFLRGLLTRGLDGGLPPDEDDLVQSAHEFVLRALGNH